MSKSTLPKFSPTRQPNSRYVIMRRDYYGQSVSVEFYSNQKLALKSFNGLRKSYSADPTNKTQTLNALSFVTFYPTFTFTLSQVNPLN